MNKTTVNGVQLAYRDAGAGQPIVFLHAFPLNQTMWDEQVATLSRNYRVITFDWRGFGASEVGEAEVTMDVFADDLAALLDELQIERATICGLSMGGYAVFAFYRKYAHRVKALILADTRATADTEEGKKGRYEMAELARKSGAAALVEPMTPKLLGVTSLQNNPTLVERVQGMIRVAQAEGIARALLGMAQRIDATDLLAQIICPTLVIVGSEDKLTPPSDSEKMSQRIPNAQLEIIATAGHLSNLEQSETFDRLVADFLQRSQT
jgi:3-oxoadipate enol-lactonase